MREDVPFLDRTVVVTGGSSGIGAAIVKSFRDQGAAVYSLDRQPPRERQGIPIEADVTRPEQVEAAIARAVKETGRLDVVVAAAGINRDHVVWKMTDEDWRAVMAVNLDGAFHLVRAAVPHLRTGGGGSIVLISSINGQRGKVGQSNYAASKAALIGLGRSTAREVGRFGIRVNVVAPGFIETPMTDVLSPEWKELAANESALGRIGKPEDVAAAVLFLSSNAAGHITGQVLRVDGGQYM